MTRSAHPRLLLRRTLMLLLFGSCAPYNTGFIEESPLIDEAPVSTSLQPLWIANPVSKWPNGDVEVCFDNTVPVDMRERIRGLITNEWGRAAKVQFFGFFDCPANPAGRARVVVDASIAPLLGQATLGFPGSGGTSNVTFPNTMPSDKTIVHEFGHVLGFIHEHFDDTTCNQRGSGGTQLTGGDVAASVMSQTACNGAGTLSRWDIVGVRIAYGQRPAGEIVATSAQCLDIPPGSPAGTQAQFFGCTNGDNQKFRRDTSFHLFLPTLANSFLDIRGGNITSGAAVQTFFQNVPASAHQQWHFSNVQVIALGGTCVDVPGFNFANGQRLQIFGCNGGSNQRWNVSPDGRISNGGFCWDVPGGATANGTGIQLFNCHGGPTQQFTMTSNGQLQFGGKCVDVVDAVPFNGMQLQLFTCKGEGDQKRFNQKFHVRGPIQVGGTNFCLDVPGGSIFDQERAQILACDGTAKQTFDFYFGR